MTNNSAKPSKDEQDALDFHQYPVPGKISVNIKRLAITRLT